MTESEGEDRKKRPRLVPVPAAAIVVAGVVLLIALSYGAVLMLRGAGSDHSAKGPSLQSAEKAYEQGDYAAAEKELRRLRAKDSDDPEVLQAIARVLHAQGKLDEAKKQYAQLLETDPKNDEAWYQLALLERSMGQTEKSAEHIAKALSLHEGDYRYTDELARTKMSLGFYLEAASLWGELATNRKLTDADRKNLFVLQAQAYQAAREYDKAKRAYELALELDPSDKSVVKAIAALE